MAKLSINAGATSQTVNVFIQDSSKTDGSGLTGLVYNSSGLLAYYVLPQAASAAITLATLAAATSAWSSGGFKEIDATHCAGLYRLDVPNAAIASGRFSTIYLYGATNMAPCVLEIDLQSNTYAINGVAATSVTTINANQGTTQPINFTGTAGSALAKSDMVDVAGAAVSATTAQIGTNVVNWNNTVVASPATAGIPEVNVKNMNNVAATAITTIKAVQGLTTADTIATYTGNTVQTGDSYARLGAPAGASVSADIAAIRLDTNTTIPNLIAALNNISSANVKTQVVAALNTDTYAEPAQGAPTATTTLVDKIGWTFKLAVNKKTQTASQFSLYNAAGAVIDAKSATSDDGTIYTAARIITGP